MVRRGAEGKQDPLHREVVVVVQDRDEATAELSDFTRLSRRGKPPEIVRWLSQPPTNVAKNAFRIPDIQGRVQFAAMNTIQILFLKDVATADLGDFRKKSDLPMLVAYSLIAPVNCRAISAVTC